MPSRIENGARLALRASLPAVVTLGSLSLAAHKTKPKNITDESAPVAARLNPQTLGAFGVSSILMFPGEAPISVGQRTATALLPVHADLAPPPSLATPDSGNKPNSSVHSLNLNTPMWQCIRWAESNDQYNNPDKPSGAYGILVDTTWRYWLPKIGVSTSTYPTPASAPQTVQDAVATALYDHYGFKPWNDYCTGR